MDFPLTLFTSHAQDGTELAKKADSYEFADTPFGMKKWWLKDKNETTFLHFHRRVERPGEFCCNSSGICMNVDKVKDKVFDCDDKSDEDQNRIEESPDISTEAMNVTAHVNILKVLDISKERSTFTIYFWLRLEWLDPSKEFFYLKEEDYTENNINDWREKLAKKVKFLHLYDNPVTVFEDELFIKRSSGPVMDGEMETLMPREKHLGSQNSLFQESLNQAEFACTFDNIRLYPFGLQNCSFTGSVY